MRIMGSTFGSVDYLRAGGKSVQLPCATSAAMPRDSPNVGCGWMVLPMSTVLFFQTWNFSGFF